MRPRFFVEPEAELNEAFQWYESRVAGLGGEFTRVVRAGEIRRALLRRFPYAGGSGGPLSDTWRWDGHRWTRLELAPTPGRFNTAMARDPASSRLVRYGGWDGKGRASDTWELQAGGWMRLALEGPPARNHAVLVSAPDRGSLLLYGGHDGEAVFEDLWELKAGTWTAITKAPPAARVLNGH
jgi:hypothetical protein